MKDSKPPSSEGPSAATSSDTGYRITLTHALELDDAPDFVAWPPRIEVDVMLAACEAELRRRRALGLPWPRMAPATEEFVW